MTLDVAIDLSASGEELRDKFLHLETPQGVAEMLEIPYDLLIHMLYRAPANYSYRHFEIPKRGGGKRQISAPAWQMRILQRKLHQVLEAVYVPKACTHGFQAGRSILSNARPHRGKRYVLNVDLKDFFPTIYFRRVRGMFMKKPYERPPAVATVLAQLCCDNGALPQGAPTSPIVSNMVCARLDGELQALAKRHRCTYTRYADDITYSTTLPIFPRELAIVVGQSETLTVGTELEGIIQSNGFEINIKKQRLQPMNRRQEVTGLIVNRFPNVPRRFIRQIRAMLHIWEKYELAEAQARYKYALEEAYGPKEFIPSFESVVLGKLEFVRMVKGDSDPVYRNLRSRVSKMTTLPEGVADLPTLETIAQVAAYQMASGFVPSGTITFFFTDIENSTPIVEAVGDVGWMQLLKEHDEIIKSANKGFGTEFKKMGDAFMYTFPSAVRAVECAMAIQRNFEVRNKTADIPIKVRIGLHTGEAIEEESDFYGYHVHFAARVASEAAGGQITISDLTRQMIAHSGQFQVTPLGAMTLKGIQGEHLLYAIEWNGEEDETTGNSR